MKDQDPTAYQASSQLLRVSIEGCFRRAFCSLPGESQQATFQEAHMEGGREPVGDSSVMPHHQMRNKAVVLFDLKLGVSRNHLSQTLGDGCHQVFVLPGAVVVVSPVQGGDVVAALSFHRLLDLPQHAPRLLGLRGVLQHLFFKIQHFAILKDAAQAKLSVKCTYCETCLLLAYVGNHPGGPEASPLENAHASEHLRVEFQHGRPFPDRVVRALIPINTVTNLCL
mmetsp:Transcript_88773/g.153734  ORF Transcript_88773/g.153734 Transcript_88773/m.153734 type:complete len:225 (-) Transcript_88773:421-1095(-)